MVMRLKSKCHSTQLLSESTSSAFRYDMQRATEECTASLCTKPNACIVTDTGSAGCWPLSIANCMLMVCRKGGLTQKGHFSHKHGSLSIQQRDDSLALLGFKYAACKVCKCENSNNILASIS